LGRNGGTVVKVLTAAVFLMTIASILSGNVSNNREQQDLSPKSSNGDTEQASSPHTPPPEFQSHGQDEHAPYSKSNTVSTYIQDKIATWKLFQSTNRYPPSSPNTNTLQPESINNNSSTTNNTSSSNPSSLPIAIPDSPLPSPLRPTILKLSMLTSWDQSAYERALHTHSQHSLQHSYPFHILRVPILADIWSKPAYILSHLLLELSKPVAARAQWLFWFDADTIILNKLIPLQVFLPPATFDDINLLVGHDWNGLNNGVYPLRIHPWSVELLSTILAFPIYKPDEALPLRDQSAMASILNMPRFKRHTAVVPMHWFNGYHRVINASAEGMMAKKGDLLVHLAGVPERFAVMEEWLRRVEDGEDGFEVEFEKVGLREEIRGFWEDFEEERKREEREVEALREEVEGLEGEFAGVVDGEGEGEGEGEMRREVERVFERKRKVWEDFYARQDLELVRGVVEELREVSGCILPHERTFFFSSCC